MGCKCNCQPRLWKGGDLARSLLPRMPLRPFLNTEPPSRSPAVSGCETKFLAQALLQSHPSPLQNIWHSTPASHFCPSGRNNVVQGPQMLPECHGRPSPWAAGHQFSAVGPGILSFRENLCEGQRSHYSHGCCGCCPGLWPRCHMLSLSLSLLSPFVCGDTDATLLPAPSQMLPSLSSSGFGPCLLLCEHELEIFMGRPE